MQIVAYLTSVGVFQTMSTICGHFTDGRSTTSTPDKAKNPAASSMEAGNGISWW
ncbi:hypothetical protein IQ244_29845 [Nostoc sp. LEGE 06077]|uniref:hypothetical protein n=1 Tax=Nostoc sp. LEGE 06077 TaxID=915325 RepID=UPI001880586C|nr:hypothetical protein [Nostoc sp. LEGE 06077]MBE9210632.1 hypothetical protein [Nostoc sp. LEGE 06077]